MKTDKNTVIGFVLLGILMFLYFWYTSQQQNAIIEMKKREEDSLAKVAAARMKLLDTVAIKVDSLKRDSAVRVASAGSFTDAAIGQETVVTLENELVKVNLTNKGAQIKSVVLKQYKDAQDQPVVLLNNNTLAYAINTAPAQSAGIENLYFTPGEIVKNADGSQTLQFKLASVNGQSVVHTFTLAPNSYNIGWKLGMNGAAQLLTNQQLNLNWTVATEQMEKTSQYERQVSNICFSEDNEFDYISSNTDHTFEKPAQWVSVVQQFFNSTLIADNSFNSGSIKWARATDSSRNLANTTSSLQVKVPSAATVEIPFRFYIGPNEYEILSKQAPEMDKIINLGRDMYSFVRPINKYIIMPVFDFFASFVKNYGWVIFLLTLFIRLVTAPLTYSSYLSGAKMKALRPELDVLKKKMGDDQQGFAMEQMKLFREAGVNPLGGCIPALLQIPIFFALYSFFNSQIALRGQSFLWSADLSSYDSIASLPFSIPAFGNHVSLFTITAVLTSFLISIYNMSMTPTQDNPALKYMPYIFPFMLLFIFNSLPSALTWYYTVSNVITLLLQFVIQNYIIDHDKILAKIEAKRKAPKTKSKWQERYEQMVESQKKVQELKNKTNKK
ncbi:membrane protein insertase YidC [Sediminibacterium sp.]|uniref:membrane protein insertase YidC n=1 Tax=Sediminibacterium sp. TaxID=1917865 RepID=UPI003F69B45F